MAVMSGSPFHVMDECNMMQIGAIVKKRQGIQEISGQNVPEYGTIVPIQNILPREKTT
jgi:hypothetical protein